MKNILLISSMFLACSIHASLPPTTQQLQDEIAQLQQQVAQLRTSSVQALAPFVKVDFNPENGVAGPNIVFSGANVHVVSGSGATIDQTGKGNLIVGYNAPPSDLQPRERAGSNNLITGAYNTFSRSGGVVFGEGNSLDSLFGSILGGGGHEVRGDLSVIVGGYNNIAIGTSDVVVGGSNNGCEGAFTVVLGGSHNSTDGPSSVVVSGLNNFNEAGSVVLGGSNISIGAGGAFVSTGTIGSVWSAPVNSTPTLTLPQ